MLGVAGVVCAIILVGCSQNHSSAALEGADTQTTVAWPGDLVGLVQETQMLNQLILDEDGSVKVLYHSGEATPLRAAEHVAYLQMNHDGASVCLRLSENAKKSLTNSSDPVMNGPYNEYVAPLDGANGPGWDIVRYVQNNAQDVPGSGDFNGCDGVPSLHWDGAGFQSGSVVTNW